MKDLCKTLLYRKLRRYKINSVIVYLLMRNYYVYILASISKVLYVGVTNDLERRVKEHKAKPNPGFTERYNVNRLVYFEHYTNISDAIIREKEIKGWKRARKVALFIKSNPTWKDLSVDWED